MLIRKCNILDMILFYVWIECANEKIQYFKHYAIVDVMRWHHLNVLSENWYNFTHKYYSTFFSTKCNGFCKFNYLVWIMKLSWANCLLHNQTVFWINLYHFKINWLCSSGNTWKKSILAAQLLWTIFCLNVLMMIYICVLDYSFLWKHKILHAFLLKHIQQYNEQHLQHQMSIIMSNIYAMNVYMLNTSSMKLFWIIFHVSTFINISKSCHIH